MSVLAHIGRGIEKKLLTAIVRSGRGRRLLEQFAEMPGVLSISHHHARGAGGSWAQRRQGFYTEQDLLILLVEAEHADAVFATVFAAAGLAEQGAGMIFSETVLRGHPMMPLDTADW